MDLSQPIRFTYVHLFLLFLLFFAYRGFRRGWQEEGITALVLLVGYLLFLRAADFVLRVLISGLNRIGQVFGFLLSSPARSFTLELDAAGQAIARMVLFVLLFLTSNVAGSVFGRRRDVRGSGKLAGSLVGILNGAIFLALLLDPWEAYVQARGNPVPEEITLILPGLPNTNFLSGLLPFLWAAYLILVVVALILWFPRWRE